MNANFFQFDPYNDFWISVSCIVIGWGKNQKKITLAERYWKWVDVEKYFWCSHLRQSAETKFSTKHCTDIEAYKSWQFPSLETQGSQLGREKRQNENFQVKAEEPLGTDSHRTISKNSSGCRLLIGHKNALYYCAQSANSFSWVLFVSSYTTAIVSITACLAHAPKKCTQSGNFQFDIKSPSDFKILSARKLKTLFQKYKLQLTTGIPHACISLVLREYLWRVFKRYHDGWQPQKRGIEKWIHIFFSAMKTNTTDKRLKLQERLLTINKRNTIR